MNGDIYVLYNLLLSTVFLVLISWISGDAFRMMFDMLTKIHCYCDCSYTENPSMKANMSFAISSCILLVGWI